MQRTAVFIDAGYLFAQGSVELLGKKRARSALHLDAHAARDFFRDLASQLAPRSELLRIYWYDGTSSGPTSQHLALAHLDDVKVRLGFVNSVGEQKGVDSLIVTDMIELARNRAIADAILLSGDEDLRVGVQQAQEFGVRVHCVGIRPARGSQSLFLLMEADSTRELDGRALSGFLRAAETRGPTPDVADPGDPELSIEDVCARVVVPLAERQGVQERAVLLATYRVEKKIPAELDRTLLIQARNALGGQDLDGQQKKILRQRFIDNLQTLAEAAGVAGTDLNVHAAGNSAPRHES